MSVKNWEDFLTGKDDDNYDDDEVPVSTLKLPGTNTSEDFQPPFRAAPAPAACIKHKVETLEEKIARFMARINGPKLDSQKSLSSMGADLRVGDVMDAKDERDDWCESQIKEVDVHTR